VFCQRYCSFIKKKFKKIKKFKNQKIKSYEIMNLSFLVCQKWYSEDLPQIAQTLARYGHTAVAKGRLVYLFLSQSPWSIILSC
jgi:hypothetical protein